MKVQNSTVLSVLVVSFSGNSTSAVLVCVLAGARSCRLLPDADRSQLALWRMMRRIPRTFLGAFVIVTSAFAFRPLVPAPETSTAAAASTASRRRCSVWPVSRRASLWESRARRTSAGAEWEGWLALHAGRSGDGGGGLEQESLDAGEDTVSPRGDVRAEPCREIGEDVEQATDSGDAEANRERTLPRVETPHLGAGGGDAHEVSGKASLSFWSMCTDCCLYTTVLLYSYYMQSA